MTPAWTISKKEYNLAMRSVTTYIIFALFLLSTGLYFANTMLRLRVAEMRTAFDVMHLIFIFYIPALTMGSISTERARGTLELLSTMPIKLSHIIWGKLLAVVKLLSTALVFTLVYVGLISYFGYGVDYGAILTGYLGLIMAGAAYASIGIFASAMSANQVLSFVLGLAISAFFFLLRYVTVFIPIQAVGIVESISFDHHLQSFFKGVLDTRDILFFLILIMVFKYLAEFKLQSRNLMQER